jgi:hypothetical protein
MYSIFEKENEKEKEYFGGEGDDLDTDHILYNSIVCNDVSYLIELSKLKKDNKKAKNIHYYIMSQASVMKYFKIEVEELNKRLLERERLLFVGLKKNKEIQFTTYYIDSCDVYSAIVDLNKIFKQLSQQTIVLKPFNAEKDVYEQCLNEELQLCKCINQIHEIDVTKL